MAMIHLDATQLGAMLGVASLTAPYAKFFKFNVWFLHKISINFFY